MKNRRCPNHTCCIDYECGACETCYLGNHILKLHKKIDNLKKKTKWISVEERLPEKDAMYLVHQPELSYDNIRVTFFRTGEKYYEYMWKRHYSHWMPLPEAPKMKGGAE